jgi:hypothetical protein
MVVKATHEPIIPIELFEEVQDILNGRKRKFPTRQTAKEELPLRGYLTCVQCGGRNSQELKVIYVFYLYTVNKAMEITWYPVILAD